MTLVSLLVVIASYEQHSDDDGNGSAERSKRLCGVEPSLGSIDYYVVLLIERLQFIPIATCSLVTARCYA